jgi:predicted amidophosphoribosyltransferase
MQCGMNVGMGNSYCATCGSPVEEGYDVCGGCGAKLSKGGSSSAGAVALTGSKKTFIALICFFLGAFGVHNFMLGETKKGIMKIFLTLACGIGEILALIDFVKILIGTYTVKAG